MVTRRFSQSGGGKRFVRTLTQGGLLALLLVLSLGVGDAHPETAKCAPTSPDALGPFYKPDAPVRSSVGKGYVLKGFVRSSTDCRPIAGARIELWLVGPDAVYDDDRRATVYSDETGGYRFESNFPSAYAGRPPHIHIKISAEGFRTLVTQHYPARGEKGSPFDLVLVPLR